MSGFILDAGGLIALDRNHRRVRIAIPAAALAQAIRNPARQVRLSRVIRQSSVDLIPLNGPGAVSAGILLARTGTADIADAHVLVCAQRAAQPVMTSDSHDLRQMAPDLRLIEVQALFAPC